MPLYYQVQFVNADGWSRSTCRSFASEADALAFKAREEARPDVRAVYLSFRRKTRARGRPPVEGSSHE